MLSPLAAYHVDEISNDFTCAKHSSIHPASPLFHKHHHRLGCVCECLCVRYISQLVSIQLFDVDLEAHNAILSQVLVSFCTCGDVFSRLISEKHLKRLTFNSFPTEERVGTRQYLSEAEERFTGFIGCVT